MRRLGVPEAGSSASFDHYRFLRESATEVRLGYAASARQSLSFTDGSGTEEASDLADFGTEPAELDGGMHDESAASPAHGLEQSRTIEGHERAKIQDFY